MLRWLRILILVFRIPLAVALVFVGFKHYLAAHLLHGVHLHSGSGSQYHTGVHFGSGLCGRTLPMGVTPVMATGSHSYYGGQLNYGLPCSQDRPRVALIRWCSDDLWLQGRACVAVAPIFRCSMAFWLYSTARHVRIASVSSKSYWLVCGRACGRIRFVGSSGFMAPGRIP